MDYLILVGLGKLGFWSSSLVFKGVVECNFNCDNEVVMVMVKVEVGVVFLFNVVEWVDGRFVF